MSSRLVFKMTEASENDYISVELEPEKKGLLLKHREYTVTSRVSAIFYRYFDDFLLSCIFIAKEGLCCVRLKYSRTKSN